MPDGIQRSQLTDRMRRALDDGCLLVVAPAGYGKTLAVQQAVEAHDAPAIFHACRERDADGGRLIVSILEAVRRTVPGAADVLLDQLGEAGETVDPATAAQVLVDDLGRLLVEPLILVVDDVERLGDAPPAIAVLGALLEGAGGPLRLVVASRRRPPLKLAKLTAAGLVTELGEADLVFSAEECAAVLEARDGRPPSDAEVEATMSRTLGWPLGVALGAARAADGAAAIEQFLVEEVLDELDAATRSALLDSSVVDELSPATLGALGLEPGVLESAARLGLSLREVAGSPGVTAWHPLVREALRSRWARERGAEDRAALMDRAAGALAQEGRHAEAVEAWLDAGRGDQALGLMLADAPTLVRASPDLLCTWLDRLGPAVRGTPGAAMLDGLLLVASGRLGEAVDVLYDAGTGLAAAGLQEPADVACAALLEASYWSGRLDEVERIGKLYDDPEPLAGRPIALVAAAWTAILHAARGDAATALGLRERILVQPGSGPGAQVARIADAYLWFPAGRHEEMLAQFSSVDHVLDRPEQVLYVLAISAFAHVDVGRVEETLDFNERLTAEVQRSGTHPFIGTLGPALRGWTLAVAGRYSEADAVVQAVVGSGGAPPDAWAMAWVPATVAITAAARGDAETARGAAEFAIAQTPRMPIMFADFLICSLAPALAEIGDRDRALALIEEGLTRVETRLGRDEAGYHVARLLVLRAWIREQEGDVDGARGDVADALALLTARPEAAAHLVRAEWPRLRALTWDLLAEGALPAAPVVGAVAGAFGDGPDVLELASHPSAAVRIAAASAIAASGHPVAGSAIKALENDEDPAVAAAITEAVARVRRRPPARVFSLLGGFRLRRGAWEVDERTWGRPTVVRLVRFLLVNRGAPVAEERILEALWPDRPADKARSALQVAVSRARQVVDPPGTESSAIKYSDRAYILELDERDVVDAERFTVVATEALATIGPARRGALESAAGLWAGTPLPEEEYADWATDWREELEALLHRVLVALGDEHRAAGDELAVAAVGRRLVALDPLDEGAHRMLITAHARTGRRSLALRQYLECRRLLVEGAGIEPDADTTGLQRRVLAGMAV
ncbi:BTAD domain-containing putative transcriptional regulator [Baekduia sp. Peel2402]|uniref:BTAD domain-containing putative transcriptional regulator n=1 Tax=Baekduia sp. Peel2402 TaxID=3458296 RepID=UPI00403E744C